MKRSWMGAGLLLLLLVCSLLVTRRMARIHQPITASLTAAGEAALSGNWNRAQWLCAGAEQFWQEKALFRACFADHNPTEEVESAFAQLKIYLRKQEATAFAAACGETAQKAKAIGDAHSLCWKNFF